MDSDKRHILIAFLLCICFVTFSSIFVIGDYHNHSDDFGQYYLHASNIINGRPWGTFLEHKPAVLPAYPMILAVFLYFFGLDGFWIGLTNSIAWAICCYCCFLFFRNDFKSNISVFLLLIVLLSSPYVISFQQTGQPNLLYAASFMGALWAAKSWNVRSPQLIEIGLVLLPALIRIESVALYAMLAVYGALGHRWSTLLVSALGITVTLSIDSLLAYSYGLTSNVLMALNVGRASEAEVLSVLGVLQNMAILAIGYIISFCELLLPKLLIRPFNGELIGSYGLTVGITPLHFILPIAAFAGFVIRARFLSLDSLGFIGHLGIISAFLVLRIPERYFLPILPILTFYFIYMIDYFILGTSWRLGRLVAAALVVGLIFAVSAENIRSSFAIPRFSNNLLSADARNMARWVSHNQDGRKVGYWQERLARVLLDAYGGDPSKTVEVQSQRQAARLVSEGGMLIVMKTPVSGCAVGYKGVGQLLSWEKRRCLQEQLAATARDWPYAKIAYENSSFVVFTAHGSN